MRILRLGPFLALSALFSLFVQAQQAVPKNPTAVSLLQKAVVAMASNMPSDSSATGTITVVEGSSTQNGTISVLARGTDQTSESMNLPEGQRRVVYSQGNAIEVNGDNSTTPPMELVVTDQSPDFPLPLLASILNNTDEAFLYIGQETLNGVAVQHIQVWNSFASNAESQGLAPFTKRDIWLGSTGLPVQIAYTRRAGGGSTPGIPVEVLYSNYTNVSGVLYPFQISKSYNGSLWETISISSVAQNTGLTDSNFLVQ